MGFFQVAGRDQKVAPLIFFPQSVGLHGGNRAQDKRRPVRPLIIRISITCQNRFALGFEVGAAIKCGPCLGHVVVFSRRLVGLCSLEMEPRHDGDQVDNESKAAEQNGEPSPPRTPVNLATASVRPPMRRAGNPPPVACGADFAGSAAESFFCGLRSIAIWLRAAFSGRPSWPT